MDKYVFRFAIRVSVTTDLGETEARSKLLFVLRNMLSQANALIHMKRFIKLVDIQPVTSPEPEDSPEADEIKRLDSLESADDFNPDIVAGYL